jgi:hypothetical protein
MSEAWATVAIMGDVTQVIRLEAWTQADLSLLRQANTPEMTAHLGGPETEDKLLDRNRRYLQRDDPGSRADVRCGVFLWLGGAVSGQMSVTGSPRRMVPPAITSA